MRMTNGQHRKPALAKLPNVIAEPAVVSSADDAIASACNRHFCSLKCGIVSGRESSISRRSVQRCISQIATDDGPQFIQFLLRCFVLLDFVICE